MDKHTVDIIEEPLPQTNMFNLFFAMLTTSAKLTKVKFTLKQYSQTEHASKSNRIASYPHWGGACMGTTMGTLVRQTGI